MTVPRPSPRRLGAVVAILGVLASAALLIVPVDAAFADDPLLRLRPSDPAAHQAASRVDCGVALTSLRRRSEGLTFYGLARDQACRQAGSRRAAAAVAAGGVVALLGLIGITGSSRPAR